ncbi:MAG: ATP-binding cassette domain-containing protein, partial [Nitrospiraceae bacterium]
MVLNPSPRPCSPACFHESDSVMDACYQLRDVGFRYAQPWVLEGCSLDVSDGEILGVVGANGSGKTSLLKLMAGLLRPQKGQISLHGSDVATLPPLA